MPFQDRIGVGRSTIAIVVAAFAGHSTNTEATTPTNSERPQIPRPTASMIGITFCLSAISVDERSTGQHYRRAHITVKRCRSSGGRVVCPSGSTSPLSERRPSTCRAARREGVDATLALAHTGENVRPRPRDLATRDRRQEDARRVPHPEGTQTPPPLMYQAIRRRRLVVLDSGRPHVPDAASAVRAAVRAVRADGVPDDARQVRATEARPDQGSVRKGGPGEVRVAQVGPTEPRGVEGVYPLPCTRPRKSTRQRSARVGLPPVAGRVGCLDGAALTPRREQLCLSACAVARRAGQPWRGSRG